MVKVNKAAFLSILLIILLGIISYANALKGEFTWDDKSLIQENLVLSNWSYLPRLFFSYNIISETGKVYHFYRPIQIITYMTDHLLWNLNVVGYHLTSIFLHIIAALGAYFLVKVIFGDRLLSLITAVIFVVHPAHTEAVSYISGRADPLAALFVFLSLILYIKSLDKNSIKLYAVSIFSFVLALFSRESAIILPILLLVYHYSQGKRLKVSALTPFIIVTLIYIFIRTLALKMLLPVANVPVASNCFERLPGFFVALTNYIKILVFPFGLHMEYGNRLFPILDPRALLGLAILVLILAYAFIRKDRHKLVTFSILWFVTTLIPGSNIYPATAYMAEHWLYLPSLGFFLIVAMGLRKIFEKSRSLIFPVGVTAALVIFYACLTVMQNNYWRTPIPFYERTMKYAPDSPRVNNDLAIAYEKAGRHADAIALYEKMLKVDPGRSDTYVNLGAAYIVTGRAKEAIAMCEKAIEIEPVNATAHNNLAVAYYMTGQYDLAITHCNEAIKLGYRVNPRLIELLKPHLPQR